MNSVFYLAIARLPLSLVATIEFVAIIAVALFGLRSARNYAALALAAAAVRASAGGDPRPAKEVGRAANEVQDIAGPMQAAWRL